MGIQFNGNGGWVGLTCITCVAANAQQDPQPPWLPTARSVARCRQSIPAEEPPDTLAAAGVGCRVSGPGCRLGGPVGGGSAHCICTEKAPEKFAA